MYKIRSGLKKAITGVVAFAVMTASINFGSLQSLIASAMSNASAYTQDLRVSEEGWKKFVVSADNVKVSEQNRGWDSSESYYISPASPHSSGSVVLKFDAGTDKVFGDLSLKVKGKTETADGTETHLYTYVSVDDKNYTEVTHYKCQGQKEDPVNVSGLVAGAESVYVKIVMYTTNFADWTRFSWVKVDGHVSDKADVKTYTPSNTKNTGVFFKGDEHLNNMIESYNMDLYTVNADWGKDSAVAMQAPGDTQTAYAVFKFDAGEGKVWNALRGEWKAPVYWDQSYAAVYASTDGAQWNLLDKASNNGGSLDGRLVNLTSVAAGSRYLYIKLSVYQQATGGVARITMFNLCQVEGNYVDMTRVAQEVVENTPANVTSAVDINPVSDTSKNLIEYAGMTYVKDKANGGTADYDNFHPAESKNYSYATYRFYANKPGEAEQVFQSLKLSYKARCADPGTTGILVSTDGEHWSQIKQFCNNGHDLDTTYIQDLTGIAAGRNVVYIKFVMCSRDGAGNSWIRYINVDAYNGSARWRAPVTPITGNLTVSGAKTTYVPGEAFDLTGLQVAAADGTVLAEGSYFVDDRPGCQKIDNLLYVSQTPSNYKLPITYLDANGVHTGSLDIKVAEAVGEIKITKKPTQLAYRIGDVLNPAGLEVTHVKDGVNTVLSSDQYTLSQLDSAEAGQKTITVSYAVNSDVTLTAAFTVSVVSEIADDLRLELPESLVFDAATDVTRHIKVYAVYNGGTEIELSAGTADGYLLSGVDTLVSGEQTATVTYSGIEKTFKITVNGPSYINATASSTVIPWEVANMDPEEKLWESHMVAKTAGLTTVIVPQGEGWGKDIRWRMCVQNQNQMEGVVFRFDRDTDFEEMTLTYKGLAYGSSGRLTFWVSQDGENYTLVSKRENDGDFENEKNIDFSDYVKGHKTIYVKIEMYNGHERNDLVGVSWLNFKLAKTETPETGLLYSMKKDADQTASGGSLPFKTNFATSEDVMPSVWEATNINVSLVNPNWDSSIQNYVSPATSGQAEFVTFRFDAPENCTFGNTLMKLKGRAYSGSTINIYASNDNATWGDPVQTFTQDNGNEFQTERKVDLSVAKDWDTLYLKFEMTSAGQTDWAEISWLSLSASFATNAENTDVERYVPFSTRFSNTDYLAYVVENNGLMAGAFYDIMALTPPELNKDYYAVFQFDAEPNEKFDDVRLTYSGRAINSGVLTISLSTDGGKTWTTINEITTDGIPADGAGDYASNRVFNISDSVKGLSSFQIKANINAQVSVDHTALTYLKINGSYIESGNEDNTDGENNNSDGENNNGTDEPITETGVQGSVATAMVLLISAAGIIAFKKKKVFRHN